MGGANFNQTTALDHRKQCRKCWLTTSSLVNIWPTTAQAVTSLPCVVKLTDALCFRCAGRRQQLPEPVGVHQWHHRADGTGVKGTQLSGLPALLRGAALVWRAEATPHGIRLTCRCFGPVHVPVHSLWARRRRKEGKRLVSTSTWCYLSSVTDVSSEGTRSIYILATRHRRVKNTCRCLDFKCFNFKFLLQLLFGGWVSLGSEKTATKLQLFSVETEPEWRHWVHDEFLWVEGRGVIACKGLLLVSYWFNVIVFMHKHKWECVMKHRTHSVRVNGRLFVPYPASDAGLLISDRLRFVFKCACLPLADFEQFAMDHCLPCQQDIGFKLWFPVPTNNKYEKWKYDLECMKIASLIGSLCYY